MLRLLALIVLVALASACGTLPTKPITDLTEIAGVWTGTFTSPQGTAPFEMTVKTDGTYEGATATGTFSGTLRVSGGRVYFRNSATGRTGVFFLRLAPDGSRVLITESDDGVLKSESRPAR